MSHGFSPEVYRLYATFEEVVKQLEHKLDRADFEIIRGSQSTDDMLNAADEALKHSKLAARFREAMVSVICWLDKNSTAIDVVVQSSPQICRLNLMGLIWGGLKFLIIVCVIPYRATTKPVDFSVGFKGFLRLVCGDSCDSGRAECQHPNLGYLRKRCKSVPVSRCAPGWRRERYPN